LAGLIPLATHTHNVVNSMGRRRRRDKRQKREAEKYFKNARAIPYSTMSSCNLGNIIRLFYAELTSN
jgi:hypothetical protein